MVGSAGRAFSRRRDHPDEVMRAHARCTDDGVVAQTRGEPVSTAQLEEMGPIDYVVLEWKGEQPTAGEVQPLLLELVDLGIIASSTSRSWPRTRTGR